MDYYSHGICCISFCFDKLWTLHVRSLVVCYFSLCVSISLSTSLYFEWGEFLLKSGVSGEITDWCFWCKTPTFQLALPEKYQMLFSSELLYLNLPTSLYTHPSFRFTLTILNRGINVEFIPTWCRGANPIAITKSRGVRAGATRRIALPQIPDTRVVGSRLCSWKGKAFAVTFSENAGAQYWLAVINNLGPHVFWELLSFLLLFWSVEWFSRY